MFCCFSKDEALSKNKLALVLRENSRFSREIPRNKGWCRGHWSRILTLDDLRGLTHKEEPELRVVEQGQIGPIKITNGWHFEKKLESTHQTLEKIRAVKRRRQRRRRHKCHYPKYPRDSAKVNGLNTFGYKMKDRYFEISVRPQKLFPCVVDERCLLQIFPKDCH